MQLHPKQKEVAGDAHRFRVVDAGRRFGKDVLGIEEAIGEGVAHPGSRIPYFAPTIQSVRDIVWNPLKQRLHPIAIATNETRLEIEFGTRGSQTSKIVLRGWEAIETERGNKNKFAVMTEVASFRDFWTGWEEVLRPTLTDLQGGAMFLSTPKGYNHFFDLFEVEKDIKKRNKNDEWKSFHFTTYDNPFIKREEIEAARASLTEDRFAQEYLAEFRKMEGLVYKEFNRGVHLFDDYTPRRPIAEVLGGLDFGFTNPTALLPIEHDVDNHYWVTKEWYKTQRTTPEIIEAARGMGINIFYPDPAEPDRVEEMQRAGLNCREVSKDIEAGIASVQNLLRNKQLHIHKDCKNLISEFESYHYPDTKPDKNAPELPVKEHDHALDALRYVIHKSAPAPVENEEEFSLYATDYQ